MHPFLKSGEQGCDRDLQPPYPFHCHLPWGSESRTLALLELSILV